MNEIGQFLGNINWANPTWDLFIVLFFIMAAFLYGLSLGRDRIIVILVSIYMALAVAETAPFINNAGEVKIDDSFVLKISTFIGVFLILFFLVSRSALDRTLGSGGIAVGRWWQVLVFSFLQVGLLISIILTFLPAEAVNHLAPLTRSVFANETAKFIWIVAPIACMAMISRKDDDY